MSIEESIKYIDQYMKDNDIPKTYLADELGVSKSAVANWFIGHREPTIYHFFTILDLLGLDFYIGERND